MAKAAELGGLANRGILEQRTEKGVRLQNGTAKGVHVIDNYVA
jgi:hypothetical protein